MEERETTAYHRPENPKVDRRPSVPEFFDQETKRRKERMGVCAVQGCINREFEAVCVFVLWKRGGRERLCWVRVPFVSVQVGLVYLVL